MALEDYNSIGPSVTFLANAIGEPTGNGDIAPDVADWHASLHGVAECAGWLPYLASVAGEPCMLLILELTTSDDDDYADVLPESWLPAEYIALDAEAQGCRLAAYSEAVARELSPWPVTVMLGRETGIFCRWELIVLVRRGTVDAGGLGKALASVAGIDPYAAA